LADIDIKFHIHKKDTHFEKSMEIWYMVFWWGCTTYSCMSSL
jgi:hypothetical protein